MTRIFARLLGVTLALMFPRLRAEEPEESAKQANSSAPPTWCWKLRA